MYGWRWLRLCVVSNECHIQTTTNHLNCSAFPYTSFQIDREIDESEQNVHALQHTLWENKMMISFKSYIPSYTHSHHIHSINHMQKRPTTKSFHVSSVPRIFFFIAESFGGDERCEIVCAAQCVCGVDWLSAVVVIALKVHVIVGVKEPHKTKNQFWLSFTFHMVDTTRNKTISL